MMNNTKPSSKINTVASRKSKAHPTSSGNSCSDRSDDQDSSEDGQSTGALMKEEKTSDDDESKRNSLRGGSKDPSQNVRAKNREHAKNTRLRKKNYIETLKDNIKEVSTTRDVREKDRKMALGKLADQNASRKKVINTFFSYRATMETSLEAWNTILASDFTCVIPVTPYRSYPPHQVFDGRRQLVGAAGMVYDTLSMYAMLYSTLKLRPGPTADLPKIKMVFEASPDSGIMQDERYMCRWSMRTEGLVANGAPFELHQSGMLAAEFTTEGVQLRHVELTTDVMSFMQQLRRSTGRDVFQVVPNAAFPLELNYNNNTNIEASYPYTNIHGNDGTEPSITHPNTANTNTVIANDATNTTNFDSIHAIQPTNESVVSHVPAVSSGLLQANNNNNTNGFTREGAMEAFLGKTEARAVVGAAEPYLLLFSNQRFQEMFQTKGLSFMDCYFPLFSSLIRSSENTSGNTINHITYYLRNGLPCNGILHCAPASNSQGAPQPSLRCLCTFYPLFAGGSVQQFLVSFDQLDHYSSVIQNDNHVPTTIGGSEDDRKNSLAKMHRINQQQDCAETGSNNSHASDARLSNNNHSNDNTGPVYEVHYHSLRQHNTQQQSAPTTHNNNIAITSANTNSTVGTSAVNIVDTEKTTSKPRLGRSRSSQSSGTSHEAPASSNTHSRYANSHVSSNSHTSNGQALSHNNSVDGGSIQGNELYSQYSHDTNLNGAELYSMLLNSSGGISGRLPELPVVSSGSSNSNTASKSGSNAGSGGTSGNNSGEESGVAGSPLQIEDFADLVNTPSPVETPLHTIIIDGNIDNNDLLGNPDITQSNMLDLNATNLGNTGMQSNHSSVGGNQNVANSVTQFRSLETETNFTDLDIDEKFFDEF